MAKLWTKEDITYYRSLVHESDPQTLGFEATDIEGKFIAYRRDGKVMKPASWEAPNLQLIINNHESIQKSEA